MKLQKKQTDLATGETKRPARWLAWFAYLTLGILLGSVFLVFYWLNQSEEVIRLNRAITIDPTTVGVNGIVRVGLDYCKQQNVSGVYSRRIVSERQEILNQTGVHETSPAGCENTSQLVLMPTQATPGTYRIKYVIMYRLNPLKETTVTLTSDPFIIK